MKRHLTLILIFLFVISSFSSTTAQISGTLTKAEFSENLEVGQTYKWRIENYQIGGNRVEQKSSPTSFELQHQSLIKLTIDQDASEIDLVSHSSLSSAGNLSDYFTLTYDDIEYNFDNAVQLYIWVFPLSGLLDDGSSINLITNFWIYNIYNIFINGDVYNFDSSIPVATVDTNTKDDQYIINFDYPSASTTIQAKVDSQTGLLNQLDFVANDIRIEIDRRGVGGGFLPIPIFWSLLPLVLLPVAYRIIKKRN